MTAEPDSLMDDRDPILDLSEALTAAGIEHKVKIAPCEDDTPLYTIEGIVRFKSVSAFSAACERTGFDAVYSAGSGWTFVTSLDEYKRRARKAMEVTGMSNCA